MSDHDAIDFFRVASLADEVAGQPRKLNAAVAEVRELMRKARYPGSTLTGTAE
jgi:hypothetical protein